VPNCSHLNEPVTALDTASKYSYNPWRHEPSFEQDIVIKTATNIFTAKHLVHLRFNRLPPSSPCPHYAMPCNDATTLTSSDHRGRRRRRWQRPPCLPIPRNRTCIRRGRHQQHQPCPTTLSKQACTPLYYIYQAALQLKIGFS